MGKQFHPQAVSAYAAVKNFDVLHKQFPDYFYREPALNPTNPSDRATDWESDIIQDFRAHPSQSEDIRFRPTLKGLVMNLSRPIKADERCLVCHDTPHKAPASMVTAYGPNNGFGWKANEIIGAQIVSVPMKLASERAMRSAFFSWEYILGCWSCWGRCSTWTRLDSDGSSPDDVAHRRGRESGPVRRARVR